MKQNNRLEFFLDCLCLFAAALIALTIDIHFNPERMELAPLLFLFLLLVVSYYFSFYFGGLYRQVWSYASFFEALAVFRGVSAACLLFFILRIFIFREITPVGFLFVIWLTTFLGLAGVRFTGQLIRRIRQPHRKTGRRTLIVGAGGAGSFVARAMQNNLTEYRPLGFADDSPEKKGMRVFGLPVLGTCREIPELVRDFGISDIVIAIPSAPPDAIREILRISSGTRAKVKILPSVRCFIEGSGTLEEIREVRLEDLLRREPVRTDLCQASAYLKDKKILITGAGGSIGSELCRQTAAASPREIILLGHGENSIYEINRELKSRFPGISIRPEIADIRDREKMRRIFLRCRPEVVFHTAAHKHVPFMELYPEEAWKNNVIGTKNVADAAQISGTGVFVLISTDKAVNPISVMGATKKIAESLVLGMNGSGDTRFAVVRFGNVLGSRGSVVPLFKRQIASGGPVTITHPDMVRFFMTIPEAVNLVIQAGAKAGGGEIFVLNMGSPVKIMDLARDMIALSGLIPEKDVKIVTTGLRPGEKLVEELLTTEEKMAAVLEDSLMIVSPGAGEREINFQSVRALKEMPLPGDGEETRLWIRKLIPGFTGDININEDRG